MISRFLGRRWKLSAPRFSVDATKGIKVPARDGIELLADLYRPRELSVAPAVLIRTPYARGGLMAALGHIFAERGYAAVIQNSRGVFGSGGKFTPFFNEGNDGVDAAEWIEAQSWYSGKLGLYGASYGGQLQWAVAAQLGSRLSAMAVMNSASNFPRMMFDGGGFRLEDFFKWASMMSQQERKSIPLAALKERIFGDPLAKKYSLLPLKTIDELSQGEKIDYWREWVAHAEAKDPFWNPIQLDQALKSVHAPVTMVTGWSDLFIKYQLQDFELLRANDKVSRITVGDWTHTAFGGMAAGVRDCLDWFGIHLQGEERGPEAMSRVSLWLNGASEWRDCDCWPPVRDVPLQLSLAADMSLKPGPSTPLSTSFVYDPSNPTPSLEGPKLLARSGREDVSSLLARSDLLVFDSAPCPSDVEIVGEMSLTLSTAADSAYHDLFVVLCDVDEKQRCINITDGYQRQPRGPVDGSTRESTISMQPCFWRVKAGHRLRLLVCGGAFPRYARNLGIDGPLQDQVDSRKVEITVRAGVLTLHRSEK